MTILRNKLVRYFFTAGAAAIVDIGGFAILCRFLPIVAAAITSFCTATVVNYLLSGRYVFDKTPTLRGFGLFFLAAVGGMLLNVSVTSVLALYVGVAPVLAKMIGVGTAFLFNFWLNQRIVFRIPSVGRNQ